MDEGAMEVAKRGSHMKTREEEELKMRENHRDSVKVYLAENKLNLVK